MKTPQMLSNEQIQVGKQISFDLKQADIDRKKNVISNFKAEGQKIHSKVLPLSDKYGCYPKASLDLAKPAHQNAFIGEVISMVNGKITNGLWLTLTLVFSLLLVIGLFVPEVYFTQDLLSRYNSNVQDGSYTMSASTFMLAFAMVLVSTAIFHRLASYISPSLLKMITWVSALLCIIALYRNYSMLASLIDNAANGADITSILEVSSGDVFKMQRFTLSNVFPLILLAFFIGIYSQTVKQCLFQKALNKERKADSEVLAELQAQHTNLITNVSFINDEVELAQKKDISVVAAILQSAFSTQRPLTLTEQVTVSWTSQSTDDPIIQKWKQVVNSRLPTQLGGPTEVDITQVEDLLHDQMNLLSQTK